MKTFYGRLMVLLASVFLPVILTGSVLGWRRGVNDLSNAQLTFVVLLLLITMVAAFLAGVHLVSGVGSSSRPSLRKPER